MLKADINTKLIQLGNVLLVIKKRLVSTIGIQYCDLNRFFFWSIMIFHFSHTTANLSKSTWMMSTGPEQP